MIISGFPLLQVIIAVVIAYVFVVLLGKPWAWTLIWLYSSWVLTLSSLSSHFLTHRYFVIHCFYLSPRFKNIPRKKNALNRILRSSRHWQPPGTDKVGRKGNHPFIFLSDIIIFRSVSEISVMTEDSDIYSIQEDISRN